MSCVWGWRNCKKRLVLQVVIFVLFAQFAIICLFLFHSDSRRYARNGEVPFNNDPDYVGFLDTIAAQPSVQTTVHNKRANKTSFYRTTSSRAPTSHYQSVEAVSVRRKRILLLREEFRTTEAERSAQGRKDPSFIAASPDSVTAFLEKHKLQVTVRNFKRKEIESHNRNYLASLGKDQSLEEYSAVIILDLGICRHFGPDSCSALHQLCLQADTGLVVFAGSNPSGGKVSDEVFSWLDLAQLSPADAGSTRIELEPASPVLNISKSGQVWHQLLQEDWYHIDCQPHAQCSPLLYVQRRAVQQTVAVSMNKKGHRTVLFGVSDPLSFFLLRILLLDAVHFVSKGEVHFPLVRRIQVDVDDAFLGDPGARPHPSDIMELIASQNRLQKKVPGFKYNFGFVGAHFGDSGTKKELEANRLLVLHAHRFRWFPHLWDHSKVNFHNTNELVSMMRKNRRFAKKHNLVNSHYAVTPHHSGIYPVHEALYTAWKQVWNITVTSTEEYMHMKPAYRRRGFSYRGIKVLPRQTCGLFTHTLTYKSYPGGHSRLNNRIFGGEIFQVLLDNPVNIFMTHYVNYGKDRLATYLLESLIDFATNWTNLHFLSGSPSELAEEYFRHYPDQLEPVWLDPCIDVRHHNRWIGAGKPCFTLPSVLLLGPEEAASKFLLSLLLQHRHVFGAKNGSDGELHFFGGANYSRGLEWYMNQFPSIRQRVPVVHNMSSPYTKPPHIVDKVTAAFAQTKAVLQAWRLVHSAHLIFILPQPVSQALACLKLLNQSLPPESFVHHFASTSGTGDRQQVAVQYCLSAGLYAKHLVHWFKRFTADQVTVICRDNLQKDPIAVMTQLLDRLKLKPIQYHVHRDSALCLSSSDKKLPACLNTSQTTGVGALSEVPLQVALQRYYKPHNHQLARLLKQHGFELPKWIST